MNIHGNPQYPSSDCDTMTIIEWLSDFLTEKEQVDSEERGLCHGA